MSRKTNRILLGLLVLTLLLPFGLAGCAKAPAALGTKDNPIILSFVPSGDTPDIIETADEICELLSDKTGYVIEGNVATSYVAVIEAMCTGKAHIGTLATFAYILANQKCGVQCALVSARYGRAFYNGEIIAGVDTGIETLADLKGKTMCWVDAASASGYIVPRIMVMAAGVDPETDLAQQTEAGGHDAVALAVYKGDCDAGACYIDARDKIADEYPDVYDKTFVVAESPEIPNDGLQFIKDFPAEMRADIVNAFLDIMETEEGVAAMGKAYGWEAVMIKGDAFYDDFRAVLDASGIDVEELAK